MAIAQPGVVVTQGLGGAAHWLLTQGYSFSAITIVVSPTSAVVPVNGSVAITSSVAANWTASGGSLVVAGDNKSATWTAPNTPGVYTVTVKDQSNPGNQQTVTITVPNQSGTAEGPGIKGLGLGIARQI